MRRFIWDRFSCLEFIPIKVPLYCINCIFAEFPFLTMSSSLQCIVCTTKLVDSTKHMDRHLVFFWLPGFIQISPQETQGPYLPRALWPGETFCSKSAITFTFPLRNLMRILTRLFKQIRTSEEMVIQWIADKLWGGIENYSVFSRFIGIQYCMMW